MRASETQVGCTYIPDNGNHIIYPAALTSIDRIQAAANHSSRRYRKFSNAEKHNSRGPVISQIWVQHAPKQTPASQGLLVADKKLKSLLKSTTPTTYMENTNTYPSCNETPEVRSAEYDVTPFYFDSRLYIHSPNEDLGGVINQTVANPTQ